MLLLLRLFETLSRYPEVYTKDLGLNYGHGKGSVNAHES